VVGLCWTFLRKVSGNVCLSELRGDDGAVASALAYAYGYGGRIGTDTAVVGLFFKTIADDRVRTPT
jgi:hypothetical protein